MLELGFGAENSLDPKKAHEAVDSFTAGLTIVPIFGAIKRYAAEKVRLRRAGTPMHEEFDLLIASTALENALVLVTGNGSDFKRLDGIEIENWYR